MRKRKPKRGGGGKTLSLCAWVAWELPEICSYWSTPENFRCWNSVFKGDSWNLISKTVFFLLDKEFFMVAGHHPFFLLLPSFLSFFCHYLCQGKKKELHLPYSLASSLCLLFYLDCLFSSSLFLFSNLVTTSMEPSRLALASIVFFGFFFTPFFFNLK